MSATLTEASPPFTKKRLGKYYAWANDLEIAHKFAVESGLGFFLTDADYQVAVLKSDGVKLIIYPHTTTGTRNQHLRVRDENSKDRRRATELMLRLGQAKQFYCTFNMHGSHNNNQRVQQLKVKP